MQALIGMNVQASPLNKEDLLEALHQENLPQEVKSPHLKGLNSSHNCSPPTKRSNCR